MKTTCAIKFLFMTFVSALSLLVSGQADPKTWEKMKTVSTGFYELQVPEKWRQLPAGGAGPEQFFEASGLSLPPGYNNAPVMVTVFLVKQNGENLEECKNECLKGYRQNSDREFPVNFTDEQEKIKIESGQDAYILHTRFFRKSKGLNQSRYDLVVFSEKARQGYIYTLSVQYADNTYEFEKNNRLDEFARKLFSYLRIISP